MMNLFIGSGTMAISCIRNNRKYIGIEKDKEYYSLANQRIEEELCQLKLF